MTLSGPSFLATLGFCGKVWMARLITRRLWVEVAAWPSKVSSLACGLHRRKGGWLLVTRKLGMAANLTIGESD